MNFWLIVGDLVFERVFVIKKVYMSMKVRYERGDIFGEKILGVEGF